MAFIQEYTSLYKTALSDLQGAWEILRDAVVAHHPFQDSGRILFHIDEGMSWEAVRDLEYMKKTLILIRNIANQNQTPQDVVDSIEHVWLNLQEVFEAIGHGEIG